MELTSAASLEQYPENKPAELKMQLPSQMHLSEDWEVAMTRITCPYTWVNAQDNELSHTLIFKKGRACRTLSTHLRRGIYRTVEDAHWLYMVCCQSFTTL